MPTSTKPAGLRSEATRYLYAGVGVADLAVEVVRDYVTEAQNRAAGVQRTVTEVKPGKVAADVAAAVKAQVKELPAKVQSVLDENVNAAGDTYDDLAQRGQTLVGRIRHQESTKEAQAAVKSTATKVKTTRTQATKAAKASTYAAKKSAADTTTAAKKATKTRTPATKGANTTARKRTKTAQSSAKATATSATKAATGVAEAVTDAAKKVGD